MFITTLSENPRYFFAVVITIVISIVLHELSHGIAAIWLGDRTPIEQDRMTLSPLVHMGVFSIVCMLLAGIAWGAMPVDRSRLRGKYAEAIVAAAGPLCNVILALLALTALGLWMRFGRRSPDELSQAAINGMFLLRVFGGINVVLALFNLIPLPPLDGSRILGNLSRSFDETVNGMFERSPATAMQFSVLGFLVIGRLISPAAWRLSSQYLQFVNGS